MGAVHGVCYGVIGDDLPTRRDVVRLCKSRNSHAMRIYCPDQEALAALRGSGIALVLDVGGVNQVKHLAANPSHAAGWVRSNVQAYYPDVLIRYVVVGNEVHPGDAGFKALLCFVYTDSLPVTEEEDEDVMCQHLLVAADRYNTERLKSICEERLCKYINGGTVTTILTLAEQHRCDGLKKACLSFLGSPANLRALLDSDGFDHLSRSCPSVIKNLIAMLAPI